MAKVYRGLSSGEYIDISEPCRVVLRWGRKGRAELLIVTEGKVGAVEKPLKPQRERDE